MRRTTNITTFYKAGAQFDSLHAEGSQAKTRLTTAVGGALAIDVPPLGFVIYKAKTAVSPSTAAPAISFA